MPLLSTENVYGGVPPEAAIAHPAYAAYCVPPGQEVVRIVNAPPDEVTVTVAVDVTEPALLVAVSVYVVVAVGLTVTEPLAEVDEILPGEIVRLVAPVVTQLRVVLDPATIELVLAENDPMTGADTPLPAAIGDVHPSRTVQASRRRERTIGVVARRLISSMLRP